MRVRGKYDAAQTNHENRRHWANADQLSADAAINPQVRRVLRSRARYEVANNGYARGMVNGLANYVVGTGPRLQMVTIDPDANHAIEQEFTRWAKAVRLAAKLWTMRVAQAESGEVFAVLATINTVTATGNVEGQNATETWITTPNYVVDDNLFIAPAKTGLVVSAVELTFLDTNVDARRWAMFTDVVNL